MSDVEDRSARELLGALGNSTLRAIIADLAETIKKHPVGPCAGFLADAVHELELSEACIKDGKEVAR